MADGADNCGTGAGGFKPNNHCQHGGGKGGKLPKGPRKRLAKALDDLKHHGERHVRGEGGAAGKLAARNEIGLAAAGIAPHLPATPPVTDADVKTLNKAYAIDLRDYDAGGPREGMAALAAKAGAIEHDLGPTVAIVTAKGKAGRLLRKMDARVGIVGSRVIEHVRDAGGADALSDAFGGSPVIQSENGHGYRRVTAKAWVRVGDRNAAARVMPAEKLPADVKAKAMGTTKQPTALSVAVLNLDADAGAPVLTMGKPGYPAEADGVPIYYRRVKAARVGKWTHRGTGEEFEITPERADEWVRNVRALSAAGVQPFLPGQHRETPNAADNFGYVVDVDREGDDVYATLALYGDEARKVAARNSRSIYVVRDARDARGRVYAGETIAHIALVPNPALPDLGGTAAIAASAGGGTVDAKVFELKPPAVSAAERSPLLAALSPIMLALAGENCGANAQGGHGFQPGNKCQRGGGGVGNPSDRYVGKGDTVKLPGGGTALVTHVNGKGDVYGVPKDKPGATPAVLGKAGELPIESKRAKGVVTPAAPAAPAKSANEPKAGNGPIASAPLPEFASRVQMIADNVNRGFGDNKVFIADAYKDAKDADPSLTEAVFKTRLREANRARLITLSRADLVSAMDPKDVAASYVNLSPSQGAMDHDPGYGGKTESQTAAHLILVKPKAGRRNVARGEPTRLSLALAG